MTHENVGDWMETFTGLRFYPASPSVDQICIEDIAHGLANTARYGGQALKFYSVAQHSILTSYLAPYPYALAALLHDASEAYICDIPRPVKELLPDYKLLEDEVMSVIREKFLKYDPIMGLDLHHRWVKFADNAALATEAVTMVPSGGKDWTIEWEGVTMPPIPKMIVTDPWVPEDAERRFLARFKMLTGWFHDER